MSGAPNTQALSLEGPAGMLEAVVESPKDGAPQGIAVVCHPHPQHGGTLHNKVTHTLARGFVRQGFAALRFNFRGTEASEGEWDGGRGEVEDVLAAAAFMESGQPGLPLWIGGFSFGAAMAIKASQRRSVAGLISVAPAVSRFRSDDSPQPDCPWLVVQGDEDELVAADETIEWINSLEPGPELAVLSGVEHFFHGRLVDLRELVCEFIGRYHN
ncbi:MAG: alpha/beta family hydrolase [Pseudomonadota bacterium]